MGTFGRPCSAAQRAVRLIAFRDYLTQHGLFATIRASRGEDIFAACGMLSTAQQQAEKKEKESETF